MESPIAYPPGRHYTQEAVVDIHLSAPQGAVNSITQHGVLGRSLFALPTPLPPYAMTPNSSSPTTRH